MISCIYKIISPSGRIYVGQTINLNRRKSCYIRKSCKNQPRLFKSILKYGFESHLFEVIEECSVENLNNRERYWQEYYNVIGPKGLNCLLTNSDDKPIIFSDFSKKKMNAHKYGNKNMLGKNHSEETKKKLSKIFKGSKRSIEDRIKISLGQTGRILSDETKRKISESNMGMKRSDETRKKISESLKGRKISEKALSKRIVSNSGENNGKSKIVLNLQNGIYYSCLREAAEIYGINKSTLNNYLIGNRINKTDLIYV